MYLFGALGVPLIYEVLTEPSPQNTQSFSSWEGVPGLRIFLRGEFQRYSRTVASLYVLFMSLSSVFCRPHAAVE